MVGRRGRSKRRAPASKDLDLPHFETVARRAIGFGMLWRFESNSVGGCQNYGPFLGTLTIRGRIILRTQKGPLFWRTTHVASRARDLKVRAKEPSGHYLRDSPDRRPPFEVQPM